MTEQPKPTPPQFCPVPAIPIVIESHRKGECRVRVDGEVSTGATLREAYAAHKISHAEWLAWIERHKGATPHPPGG